MNEDELIKQSYRNRDKKLLPKVKVYDGQKCPMCGVRFLPIRNKK